jgi:hypothetical protein
VHARTRFCAGDDPDEKKDEVKEVMLIEAMAPKTEVCRGTPVFFVALVAASLALHSASLSRLGSSDCITIPTAHAPLATPLHQADFEAFGKAILLKSIKYEKSIFYVQFISDLVRELCANLKAEEVKKVRPTTHR